VKKNYSFLKKAFKKVKIKKSIFFTHFTFFPFSQEQNFMFIKNKPLFSTYFFARAKKRALHPALVRKQSFLVTLKKCVKSYFVFNEQIVIIKKLLTLSLPIKRVNVDVKTTKELASGRQLTGSKDHFGAF
jgi:hypothetical protein